MIINKQTNTNQFPTRCASEEKIFLRAGLAIVKDVLVIKLINKRIALYLSQLSTFTRD